MINDWGLVVFHGASQNLCSRTGQCFFRDSVANFTTLLPGGVSVVYLNNYAPINYYNDKGGGGGTTFAVHRYRPSRKCVIVDWLYIWQMKRYLYDLLNLVIGDKPVLFWSLVIWVREIW